MAFHTIAASYRSHVNDIGMPMSTSHWMITSLSMVAACSSQLACPSGLCVIPSNTVRTKQHARHTVYWPGIDNHIENTVLGCWRCQDHLPSNHKEPLIHKTIPRGSCRVLFICWPILVDCYTDWPTIVPMGTNTTAPCLVLSLVRQSICHAGIPDILWTDKGSQFASKVFQDFVQ